MGAVNRFFGVKMIFTVWFLVVFLAADANQLFGKDSLPRSKLPLARPEVIEVFKDLLQKALDSENTYHRDLLVRSGIVPIPPGYESSKDEESDKSRETLSPETLEHYNKHINDILTSLNKLDYAINTLFGERLFQKRFGDLKDSWNPKQVEYLKSYKSENKVKWAADVLSEVPKEVDSRLGQFSFDIDCNKEANGRSEACKVRSSEIPELPSLPAVDFVMTSGSDDEFVTSTSVVDEITAGYVQMFSEMPESSTTQSSLHEIPTSAEMNEVSTLTPLHDEFIMHVMSSSIPPNLNENSSNVDESTTDSDQETPSETELDSLYASPIFGRVLTIEEVKLLDKSLSLKPELKYQVISTSRPDQNTLSDIRFFTTDETSSSKPISKKRRRMNPRDISLDEPIFYQAPTPEKMILRYYRDIPDTSFTCENKSQPGFYADQETDCQVFHVCWPGRRESFLCPVGSLFNQQVLSCDNFNNTNCSLSHAYFDVNTAYQEYDDAKAHNVTPSPDPMMRHVHNDSGTTEVDATKSDIVELFEADLHFSEMVNKTSITELWDYLPVKAKVFVYPEPADLKKFLEEHHHHKIRKSKDVRGLESSTETEDNTSDEQILDDEILEKRQRIEANIIRVLKKLSRKHRN